MLTKQDEIAIQQLCRQWLETQLEFRFSDTATFIPSFKNGQFKGAAGFDNYSKDNIELFMAGNDPRWASKVFIKAVFNYVFNQLGCTRCTARVDADNATALNIDKKLGFVEEGRMRQANQGKDVIILGMLKNECRWL